MSSKTLVYSLRKSDFVVKTKRGSGPGGQHRNTKDTAVTITHPESGATGEAQDSRSQHENKRSAFKRLIASDAFQKWHRRKIGESMIDEAEVERRVDRAMWSKNLLVEVWDGEQWVEFTDIL